MSLDILRDADPELLPFRARTLPEVLAWRARRQPNDLAFTFLTDGEMQEERLTYAELDRRARAVAAALASKGAAGERALLVYDAGLDYIVALYGCLYAGVIAVPVYPPDPFRMDRTLPRLQAILADAGATWLLAARETLDWAGPLFSKAPGLKSSLATDECAEFEVRSSECGLADESLALLQYTSGSTGEPRGVMISHGNLLANLTLIHQMVDRPDALAVSWLPAYHDMGLIGVTFQPVFSGRHAVLLSPAAFMQRPYRWLHAITRFRGTTTAAPNFAYDLCVRKISAEDRATLDLSSLALALNGAETVRPETLERFSETFAACGFRRAAFYPCYGLAEATLMVSGGAEGEMPIVKSFDAAAMTHDRAVPVARDPVPVRADMPDTPATTASTIPLVGCGRPADSVCVKIVNPLTRRPLPDRQVGEIWVHGPSVGGGYWNRPQESTETFVATLDNDEGPFLRTGDLGFFDGGELFITGRVKELIILQGRNHYPQDIEQTVAESHPALKPGGGAAFSIETDGGERLVVVHEVIRPRKVDLPAVAERVRARIAELHGISVAAVCLIPAGTLPKTSSGKTRRRACRDFFLAGSLGAAHEWREHHLLSDGAQVREASRDQAVAPRTLTERRLAQIWSDVLGIDPTVGQAFQPDNVNARRCQVGKSDLRHCDIHASFFDVGGQSLLASQLAARVQAEFKVELPIRVLFESPTIAGLAAWLDQGSERGSAGSLPPVIRADRSAPLPLSSFQEQLWFLEQLESDPRYLLSAMVRLRGPLNQPALERSLHLLARRYEALRTVFPAIDGKPAQVIQDVPVTECRDYFDLAHGPLARTELARHSAEEHQLSLSIHHLICDGWSLAIFLEELAALYQAEAGGRPALLPPAPFDYADFVVWQRACLATEHVRQQVEYWKQQLADLTRLELVTDFLPSRGDEPQSRWLGQSLGDASADRDRGIASSAPATRESRSYRGAAERFTISSAHADALADLGRQHDATLYMVLLAAFQTLLGRWARQDDVCLGSPVSYRPRREFERSVGYFVNTLALRTDLSGEPSFRELLARVRETVLAAFSNADAPLIAVVDALAPHRAEGRSPLFNVMFVFENLPWQGAEVAGLSIGDVEIDHTRIGSFDLALVVEQQPAGLRASAVYNAELFESCTIKQFCSAFNLLLTGIVADPDASIIAVPLTEESPALPTSFSSSLAAPPALVHDLVSAQANRTPDTIAVVHDEDQISYRQLDDRANQVAHYLQALGVGPDVPVAIFLDRSIEMVVAMLAVLKAGGAYVPLDAAEPAERLATMLDDVEARAIITTSRTSERLPPHRAEEIRLDADADADSIARSPATPPATPATSESLAYIIYTSGSTGRPKGVEVTHAGLANHALAMTSLYELDEGGRALQIISPAFDVAAEEIFPTLIRGATLVLGPPTSELTGRVILDQCRRHRVTVAHIPPPLLQQCLLEWRVEDAAIFEHWRVLVVGGEPPRLEMLNRWLELSQGRVRLLHEYGLTEATITSLVYELPRTLPAWSDIRRVPIGKPIAGTEVHVLDARQRPVPIGAPGELYLGGVGLARGYVHLDEHTAERFVPNPFSQLSGARLYRTGDLVRQRADGNVEFLGRIDEQIKLRGWRIEPKEIERALLAHPAVGEAAVVARDDAPGGKRLVAYVVSANGELPPSRALRDWLRGRLPEPMVPSAVVRLERLPLNRHHKLDVAALPAPDACACEPDDARPAFAPPRTSTEEKLAAIWQELLGVQKVGIHDNFFELGGDSILSIQVVARARQAGLGFNPRQLFQHQTIAELAAVEGTGPTVTAEQGLVAGDAPLTPVQHWFLDDDPIDPHHFNQAVLLRVDDDLPPEVLPEILSHLAAHHDALRLRFARSDDGWRQGHAPESDWPLERFDLSRLSADEQVEALETAASKLQGSLHLERGPLATAGWFDLGDGGRRLLLVVHHLVIDAVSWRVLLDDLTSLWMQLSRGESPSLPPKTTSFQYWAQRLAEYAQSPAIAAELPHWQGLAAAALGCCPRDFTSPANLQSSADVVSLMLDGARTAALLEHANAPYRTHTPEILLAALAQAIAHFSGHGTALIDIEGHGRAALFDDVDLSRTVGWFTAGYPVLLEAPLYLPPGTLLRRTKESLRRVPGHGIGYGVLRYLSADAQMRNSLAALPRAEVAFNYLGRFEGAPADSGPLSRAREPVGPLRSPRAVRRHLLELNLFVSGGRLSIDIGFSRAIHRRETIEGFAADYLQRLTAIIDHCLSPQAGGFTPSDFPLARTDERELEKISELLGDS
ncbi:MAG TPA: amino acid adenylation domain-containing protein [Pirellulales bacterium]|nr:amino acid adenylation domain-containing protein [Pirellulales bacterium]